MYRTDDPCEDARRHQEDQDEWLEHLPVCGYCGEPIQDEHLIEFDGDCFCCSCFSERHKKRTEDYMRD